MKIRLIQRYLCFVFIEPFSDITSKVISKASRYMPRTLNFTAKKNNLPIPEHSNEQRHSKESNLNRGDEGSTLYRTSLHLRYDSTNAEKAYNQLSFPALFRSIYMPFRYRLIACLHFRPTRLITSVCFRLFGSIPGPSCPPLSSYPPPRINEAFISSTRACTTLVEQGGVDARWKSGGDKRTEEDRGSNSQ